MSVVTLKKVGKINNKNVFVETFWSYYHQNHIWLLQSKAGMQVEIKEVI